MRHWRFLCLFLALLLPGWMRYWKTRRLKFRMKSEPAGARPPLSR